MDEHVLNAALAGLLHDVGKLSQRAGVGMSETRAAEARQDFGYIHALASYDFMKTFIPGAWREELSGIAYHHRPRNQRELWTQLADHLSAMEREEEEDNRIPRLQSIFCSLESFSGERRFVPLGRLAPNRQESLFPSPMPLAGKNEWRAEWQRDYEKLWSDFTAQCKQAGLSQLTDKARYLETILALLQDYTWCIPSAYWESVPDISLFDHLRTTAAFAACLASDNRSADWCRAAEDSNAEVCLLVGGDLSGLQAFIYTLASEGAAKSLRARSFYVQLLTEALALAVLRELGLPLTNALYIGGGGFQLFAHVGAQEKLRAIAQDLTDRLLTLHAGALGLTLHWMPLTVADLKDFGASRERFGRELNRRKRQPFSQATLGALRQHVGRPISQGGDPLLFCRVTGEDGDTVKKVQEEGSETYRAKFVLSLEELGRQLPAATHIAYAPVEKAAAGRAIGWQQALRVFGFDFQLVSTRDDHRTDPIRTDEFVRVWRLKPTSEADPRLSVLGDAPRVISYRPFAQLAPLVHEADSRFPRPKTFDELAQKPVRGGFKRWGVLRMDVDNLGKLFQAGFGQAASPSRIASLSFALRLFFEGYLPELAKGEKDAKEIEKQDLTNHLYLQYSGGDDVFVVGAWDALPEFARRVREAFREYTAGNPALTLSAGIALAEEKFPLYQVAEMAEAAERAAKSLRPEKDAVTFLEQALDWKALAAAQRRAYTLAGFVDSSQISRAVLQTILALRAQVARAKRDKGKVEFGRWTWLAAYQLTRAIQSIKKENESAKKEIESIQTVFLGAQAAPMELAGLAARWAQFLTR